MILRQNMNKMMSSGANTNICKEKESNVRTWEEQKWKNTLLHVNLKTVKCVDFEDLRGKHYQPPKKIFIIMLRESEGLELFKTKTNNNHMCHRPLQSSSNYKFSREQKLYGKNYKRETNSMVLRCIYA